MGGRDRETVMLLPKRVNMRLSRNSSNQEPVELPLFNIIRWELTQRNSDCPEEGIRMVVVLRRKPWREVFTTYLPTTLLSMTTYVTTFFKPQFFEAALGANLTIMLMMTTIFMTSLSELTDTAYAKWIDFWLIFSQLVPFTEVILLTLKEAYREEEQGIKKRRRRRKSHTHTIDSQREEEQGVKKRRRRKKHTYKTDSHPMATNVVEAFEVEADNKVSINLGPQKMAKQWPQTAKQSLKMNLRKLFYVNLMGEAE